ncbi:helix-turn-helix domain-containing protein [Paenibacillus sp. J5C_2022]|uniref:helix-turn-helix domain-containing protein n=1 Tax=Paenibacillus sp. J5C2022 TaxID=2977129 RepID=UPI0021CF84A2|nr:helix-turn-helix domain-containing protein [Paenibacillus sp. J5C2022]MCU6709754.1 helix-turn-helix domain-containing protein [Paenibacillus sp. J5C2022]
MNQRKTVFLTLWLSYLLILAIPVAVSAYLYHNMKDALVDNANRSNMAMLEQVREVVENHLTDLDQLSMQVANHPKLQTLWNMKDGERYIEYWEAMKVMNNMQLGSKFIHNFFLYLHDQDVILSQNMKTDTNTYFSDILPYKDKTTEEVKELLLTGYHFNSFWPSMTVYDQSKEKNMITSAVTFPLGEGQNVRATLVMYIDEQHIFNLLNQIKWANSASMYIVDATGETILSYSEHGMELGQGMLSRIQGANNYETTAYNGEKMLLSHTRGNSGWTYVSLAPEKVVLSRVTELQKQAIMLLILAVLIGTAIAYGMAYRSYSPIRDMVLSLMNGNGDAAPASAAKRMNEYEFIKSSIKHNLEEGKKLRQALEGHTPVVRAHYLSRLLKGQVTTSTFKQDSLDFIDVKFHTDYLSVALIEVDDCSRFVRNNNEEEWALVRFILANLSQELIKEKGHVIETEHNQLALLLQSPDASSASRAERDNIIAELKDLIESRFNMDITIAYSSIREGMEEVGRCYSEALSALDYRIVHGIGKMINYEDIKGLERQYYHYPMDVETQLMNMLKAGDYAGTEKLLNELYTQNITSGTMTPEMGKCLFFDLLSTVLKVMNALKLDTGPDDGSGSFDPAKEFLNSTSASDMQNRLKELCHGICSSVQEARSAQGDRLNNELLAFIAKHYKDNSLSLTMLADHFNMTPQYISGYFKKHNNRNLTDYIVDIRLTEAKRLLAESGCTVLQVAQQVGYATDIGFIRVFKKQEGITPGKYREMNAS